jgi:hypothetical protein
MIDNAKLVISLSLTEITNGDLKASTMPSELCKK